MNYEDFYRESYRTKFELAKSYIDSGQQVPYSCRCVDHPNTWGEGIDWRALERAAGRYNDMLSRAIHDYYISHKNAVRRQEHSNQMREQQQRRQNEREATERRNREEKEAKEREEKLEELRAEIREEKEQLEREREKLQEEAREREIEQNRKASLSELSDPALKIRDKDIEKYLNSDGTINRAALTHWKNNLRNKEILAQRQNDWSTITENNPLIDTETHSETIVCHACGKNNLRTAKFCAGCGTSLQKECPGCHKLLSHTAKFCSACGHAL